MHGTLAADTVGHETREDFNAQSLPVPNLGGHVWMPLTDAVSLDVDASGFEIKGWDSLRTEGGIVWLSQTDVAASAMLTIHPLPHSDLSLGYRYVHLHQVETSHEDGNAVTFDFSGPALSFDWRF